MSEKPTQALNIRIPSEYVKGIDKELKDLRNTLPSTAKVNKSTIIVGAIEEHLANKNQVTLKFPIDSLTDEELKSLYKLTNQVYKPVATWEGSPEEKAADLLEGNLRKLLKSIELEFLKR